MTVPIPDPARVLSRSETHDLSMIIKDRTRVLKAYAEEQAAACMADFEKKLAAVYSFDKDESWKAATEVAQKVVAKSQAEIAKRCRELGIPESFAPGLDLQWRGRGENAIRSRRDELRRVAKSSIEAMTKAAPSNDCEGQAMSDPLESLDDFTLGLLACYAHMNWISRAVARDTRAIPLRASSSSNSAHMAIYAGGYGDYCSAKVLA